VDRRHRRVMLENLTYCFGDERTREQIQELAQENFKRIGESYASAIKTASMTIEELKPHLEFVGAEKLRLGSAETASQSRVVAVGHFGNFELYMRFAQLAPSYRCAVTYRGLRQPALNKLLLDLRKKSDCQLFERRTEAAALKQAMATSSLLLGLLADQHAGDRGLKLPFFGRDCSTSAAPAVFALRYNCPLHTAICYRTGQAQWRVEIGDEIPTTFKGEARSVEDISREINQAFEAAVRRDPANWFWVHNRWKANKYRGGRETKIGKNRTTIPVEYPEAEG